MTFRTPILYLIVCLSLTGLLLGGCAGLSSKPPEERLQERVSGFMQAQIDQKWDQAYTYYEASYRKQVSENDFMRRPRKIKYSAYEIESVTIDPSDRAAIVKLKVDIATQGFEFKGGPLTQEWVREHRKWFIKMNPAGSRPVN